MAIGDRLKNIFKKKEETITTTTSPQELKAPKTYAPSNQKEDLYINIDDIDTSSSSDGTSYRSKSSSKIYTRTPSGDSSTFEEVKIVDQPQSKVEISRPKPKPKPSTSDLLTSNQPNRSDLYKQLTERNTYDRNTQTYTDRQGNNYSMREEDARDRGAKIKDRTVREINSISEKVFVEDTKGEQIYFSATPNQIQPAPTERQKFVSSIEKKGGIISGTFAYLGGLAERKSLEFQFNRASKNKDYELYQPFATARGAGAIVESAPYFTPIGAELLVLSGSEQLVSPLGIKARKEEINMFEAEGKTKAGSIARAVGLPLVETGLGLFGVKGKIKANQISKLQKESSEIFLGLSKDVEGGTKEVLAVRRKAGNLQSDTSIYFETAKTGKESS